MNKHARARSIGKEEHRIYHIEWMDGAEVDIPAVRDQIHGGMLMLDNAMDNGERLNISINNIRTWWSEPIGQKDDSDER